MSRSLPLGPETQAQPPRAEPAPIQLSASPDVLSGQVQVFDPAMCCPTGLCGPGVDPALMQIARDLRWLTAKGVKVERFGLSQEPQAFVANARVSELMQVHGDGGLPAVLINGSVVAHGRYPTRAELVSALSEAGV